MSLTSRTPGNSSRQRFTESIALLAADFSLKYGLAMADAIVYTTAQDQRAQLITSDADLKDLPGVVYLR